MELIGLVKPAAASGLGPLSICQGARLLVTKEKTYRRRAMFNVFLSEIPHDVALCLLLGVFEQLHPSPRVFVPSQHHTHQTPLLALPPEPFIVITPDCVFLMFAFCRYRLHEPDFHRRGCAC